MNAKTELAERQEIPIVQVQEITPMGMINTAIQRGASMDELAKLMDLQERWEANEARKAYAAAMAKFRANCPAIDRTKEAHHGKHAGLAETIDTIKKLLSECGLSHSWRTNQKDDLIEVTCHITHKMGHSECTTLAGGPDLSGSKNSIQAIGSTVAYLERYTLFAALGLASKEMDDDGTNAGNAVERISEEQALILHAKLIDNELNVEHFINWLKTQFGVTKIESMPLKIYDTAMKKVDDIIKRNKAKK